MEKMTVIIETDTEIITYEIPRADMTQIDVEMPQPRLGYDPGFDGASTLLFRRDDAQLQFTTRALPYSSDGRLYNVIRREKNPLKVKKFRKTEEYTAVKVTKKNIQKVAIWASGRRVPASIDTGIMEHVLFGGGRNRAFIGQWIVRQEIEDSLGKAIMFKTRNEEDLDEQVED